MAGRAPPVERREATPVNLAPEASARRPRLLRRPGTALILGGLLIAASAYAPLQLYISFGPGDGNPIGLGLWYVVGLPTGLIMAGGGVVRFVVGELVRRGHS